MKFWKTGIVLAWGLLVPALGYAQDYSFAHGPSFGPPPPGYGPGGYGPPGGGDLYQQLVPESRMQFENDSRRHLLFSEAFSQSYIHLDYLNWRITGGQNALLGAPVAGDFDLSGRDTDNLLLAQDANGPRSPVPTSAVVPSLEDERNSLIGLRGLIGIPTNVGTLEMEAFYFQQLNNGLSVLPYNAVDSNGNITPVIGATTLFTNGVPANNNMILYNQNYFAQEKASFFGSEANWVFPAFTPNQPLTVHPIVGFRYISFSDKLLIGGTDIPDATDPTTRMDHLISSIARNNIFGPQVGLKFATTAGRFDFGVETKFLAGINRLTEGVYTQQIYSPTEADRADKAGRTRFSPTFDLTVSSKFHMTDRFALYVAYDLLLGGNFSRAYDNIYYNSPSISTDSSLIGLKPQLGTFFAQGIAVGGEFTFR